MQPVASDFVAVVRISNRDDETLAAPGETCERVPPHLLELFEQRGNIKRVEKSHVPETVTESTEGPQRWRSKAGFQVDSRHNDKIPPDPGGEEGTEP